jgi:hypothetical protein
MNHYTLSHLEAAACLWEAVLELRDRPDAEPHAIERALAIRKTFDVLGTSGLRLMVVGWTDAVDAAWYKAQESSPFSFDWDFVPQWIVDTIDWSDPRHPDIRTDSAHRDVPGGERAAVRKGASVKAPVPVGRPEHLALLARARAALETPAGLTADGSNALIRDIAHAERRLSAAPLPWPTDVHVAVIEHRHGTNLHVALDAKALDAQVAAYCREWWREIGDNRDPHSLSDRDIIETYFDDHGHESCSTDRVTLEPPIIPLRIPQLPETGTYCVLSTAHLTFQTADRLDKWASWPPSERPIDIAASVYGWFVPTRELAEECRAQLPEDLLRLIAFGRDRGFRFVLLDCDAGSLDVLPVHDW